MTNRFIQLLWSLPTLAGAILLFCLPIGLSAQVDKFNFNYSGPSVVSAGPDCSLTLAQAIVPVPTVTSTMGGIITMSMQDPSETTGNFAFNDPIPAPYTLSVGWLVKDNMGNSAVFYFPISIVDNTPPVFDLTNHPSTLNLGSVVQVPAAVNPPVSDNCTVTNLIVVTFTETTPPDTCQAGTYTRTWKATDQQGNTTTFTQTINITADMLPPLVGAPPQNGSAPCAQLATAYPAWLATQLNTNFMVSDVSGIKSITSNGPATFPIGCAMPLTVTFRATDNCNLFTTRTATFTTSDTDPPVVAVEALDTVGYCSPTNGHLTALGKWINKHGYQQSSDPCTVPSLLTYSMKIGTVVKDSAQVVAALLASFVNGCDSQMIGNRMYGKVRGKITVEFLVRDACGNESSAGQATFGVIDTLPPVITGINQTEECGGGNDQTVLNAWINAHGNAVATDGCSGTAWTGFSYVTSTGQSGNGTFNNGPYPTVAANNCGWYVDVTFRATDDCGNVGSKALRFRLVDTTVPVIGGFTPVVTVYCPATAPTNPTATATDNCDAAVTLVHSAPVTTLSNCSGNYNVQFTWTATDDCGNSTSSIQTFQVRDTTGPVFTLLPGPKTFRCDTFVLPPPVVKELDIDADDECSVVLQGITTQVISNQDPNPAVCEHYNYQITRIFTASDDCGNLRTASQVLTIVDNLGPVPTGTLDTTVVCEVTPMVSPPQAVDACSGPTAPPVFLNQTTMPGDCENSYLLTLHWRAQDVCGNPTFFTQTIHVRDTMPPTLSGIPEDITVECGAIPAPPATSTFVSADNCDQTVTISLAETETRDPDPTHCAHWTNYLLHRTWTARDNCDNTRSYTQTIHVQDHTGPILTLPAALQLPSDAGDCGAHLTIPAPLSVFDECTSLPNTVTLRDTTPIKQTAVGPAGSTPVDTVVFHWNLVAVPPNSPAIGDGLLTIYLDTVDSEKGSERFTILGEDGQSLGLTDTTDTQCGFSVTANLPVLASKLNAWMADGQLTLRLAPNGIGGEAANYICGGGRARATLTFPAAAPQVPVTLTYQLDNNPPVSYPPASPPFVATGTHTLLYTATDCAGNSTTATMTVTIQDTEPPVVMPPAPLNGYVSPTNCLATVTLPFPVITDNCAVSGNWSKASALINVGFQNDPNAGLIPKNTNMNLNGLIPNAVGIGRLKIRHKGDNGQKGEFFNIFDENNVKLDTTTLGPVAGQCSAFHESIFTVTGTQINAWAGTNGITFFKAVANNSVPAYNDFISPCMMPLLANSTDGVSQLQAVLEYNYAHVNYEITKGGVPVQSDTLRGNQTTVTLPPGVYNVKYRVTDNSGLEGMTTFLLTVRDTVKPKAFCVSKTIQTNPSGVQNYTLLPSEINNNSTDNCSGTNLTFSLSQSTFNCSQAPNSYPVVLTVTDTAGNSASCTALIKVETTVLHPYYDGVCEGGTLKLYTDPSLAPGNTIYTFMWTGPNGYVSFDQNPIIPSAGNVNEGTYVVKITGLTGCTATGSVIVDLLNLPDQPMLILSPPPYCQGSDIMLSTPSYNGQNVTYSWYEGNQASSVLLFTTQASNYTVMQPSLGPHQYFVKISGNNCTSVNSDIATIVVNPKLIATVDQSSIVVCSGQTINFGTPVMGNGITYQWTGPMMFNSTSQYPTIPSAVSGNAGQYRLVVTNNGCPSDPVFVTVTVKDKPVRPQIVGNHGFCEGATVTLLTGNYASTMPYYWISPQLAITTTNQNTLSLPGITVADSGYWRVVVESAGCLSDTSLPFLIRIQPYPDVTGSSNSPLCSGTALQLKATGSTDSLAWCWTGPNGFIRYEQNPTVNPAVAGQYKIVGKTSFGCADSAFVNVSIVPSPVIDTVTNNAPVCASCNSTATLQAVIQPIYGPLTYMWMGPGGFISNVSSPSIPSVCTSNNGTYNLIVKDTLGCPSQMKSTVINVQKKPNIPLISPMNASVCQGDIVTFTITNANEYVGSLVQYTWKKPGSLFDVTSDPSLTVGPVSAVNAGLYSVSVTVDNCTSDISATVNLEVKPIPSAPLATSPKPILCEGETLELFANPSSGDLYDWIRIPPGISSTLPNPSYPNVNASFTGKYFVKRRVNGCWSGYSEPLQITVNPRPPQPFLLPISPVCLDDPNSVLQLCIQSGTPGAKYQFFYADGGGLPLGPPTTSLCFQTSDLSFLHPGVNTFYVATILDSCSSFSEPKNLQVDITPNITAYAGPDIVACASTSQPLVLNATAPGVGTGTWIQISNPLATIVNPNDSHSVVKGAVADTIYLFKWTLSNGACKNYSMDTVQVRTVSFESAMAKPLIKVCGTEAQLMATRPLTTTGKWTQPNTQATIGVVIDEPDSANTLVHNLLPGQTWYFIWTLKDTGCGSTSDTTEVRALSGKPYIGPDFSVCALDSCTLTSLTPTTDLPSGEFGRWESGQPGGLIFSNPVSTHDNFSTSVCNFQEGANVVYWILNDDFCPGQSRDTIVITFHRFPTARPDSIPVPFGAQVLVSVLPNDLLPDEVQVMVTDQPKHGNLVEVGEGQYNYQPFAGFSGEDQFIYKVCNLECEPDACSVTTVKLFVKDVTGCPLPTLITPNGDDVNDALVFPCLLSGDGPNNSELTVFNQWGNEVYHLQPYDNAWKGEYNGEPLPVGTYFYVLKADFLVKPESRFLLIQR